MKKIFYLVIVLAILIILATLAFHILSPNSEQAPDTGTSFPSAGINPGTQQQATVSLSDGSSVPVKDFIHDGVTIQDPANPGNYYLQGSSGACLPDGTCPSAGKPQKFSIVYFSQERAFSISLDDEPLGEARSAAEAYLQKSLGLTQEQMCALNYTLGTTIYVNPTYGSMGNLGFSFCPGAVQLPE